MEHVTWTDERLDDRFDSIDRQFDRVHTELLELRREMNAGFAELRAEISSLRLMVMRFGGGMLIAQFGMIAALIARG